MKWSNLKENRCPVCGRDWLKTGNADFDSQNHTITCRCNFKITEKKMAEIVNSKVNSEIEAGLIYARGNTDVN